MSDFPRNLRIHERHISKPVFFRRIGNEIDTTLDIARLDPAGANQENCGEHLVTGLTREQPVCDGTGLQ